MVVLRSMINQPKKAIAFLKGISLKLMGNQFKISQKPCTSLLTNPLGSSVPLIEKNLKTLSISSIIRNDYFRLVAIDKPSQGLIFLTNDGDIVNKILRAGNKHEKEYIVSVDKKITPQFVKKMSAGIPILDTVTKKCKVKQLNDHTFKIILTQGLNRQIRRMCKYLGYEVSSLKRTRIMNVHLGNLKIGQWRELTSKELQQINKMVADSSKTEEASHDEHKKK